MKTIKFISHSDEETKELAKSLAGGLRANDCLALIGGFGSGKTTFVKGLVEGLSRRKKAYVCSPSFVILKIYPGRLPVYHFDLYRLNRVRDIEAIGFDEFTAAGGVCVIEWAQRCEQILPQDALKIEFRVTGRGKRAILFSAPSPRIKRYMAKVRI